MFTKKAADPSGIYIAITLGILSTIFGLFCANYLSKLITRPLNALNNVVTKIANGDLTHVFKFKNGKDEFAYNSRFVEKMQDSLNKALRLTVDECNRIHTTLSDIQKLSDNIVIKTDATEGQALTVASASEQMVSTTQDISRNCESATLSSQHSQKITQDGVGVVKNAVQMIHDQSNNTRENAIKIESFAKKMADISNIVSTIDDIAAQTNLLALNAAIKAARAGEAGRGFVVVADEVRALASRTTVSTQEISKMVDTIQNEVNVAVGSIRNSVTSIDKVAQEASGVEDVLNNINQNVNEVGSQIIQIATAAQQQSTSTAEISHNIQTISQSSKSISEAANNTNDSIHKIKSQLDALSSELAFFKLKNV